MRTPEKSLYDYFFAWAQQQGYRTYDYLPLQAEPVKYPIVVLGETQTVPATTKYSRNDSVILTIDVWGSQKQRATVSEMGGRFLNLTIGQLKTAEYQFYGVAKQQSLQLMQDTSVKNTVFQRANLNLQLKVI